MELPITPYAIDHGCKSVKEAFTLRAYYGLSKVDPMTDRQIGKVLGVSSARVQQIRKKALDNVKTWMLRAVTGMHATDASPAKRTEATYVEYNPNTFVPTEEDVAGAFLEKKISRPQAFLLRSVYGLVTGHKTTPEEAVQLWGKHIIGGVRAALVYIAQWRAWVDAGRPKHRRYVEVSGE